MESENDDSGRGEEEETDDNNNNDDNDTSKMNEMISLDSFFVVKSHSIVTRGWIIILIPGGGSCRSLHQTNLID